MYGGEIVGNLAPNGHGGGVENYGTFNMYGGRISENVARHNSGGLGNIGTFNMRGGEISGNRAGGSGGGIRTVGGSVTLYNGTISGNTAGASGGGISWTDGSLHTNVSQTSSFVISDNRAGGTGGGISMAPPPFGGAHTFRVTEFVTISGNTAGVNGGGVHVGSVTAHLIVEGGTISNNGHPTTMVNSVGNTINIATSNGGGINAASGQTTIISGTISDNVAVHRGGGVFLSNAFALVTITGGTISNNTAGNSGGGVQISNGQLHLQGGTFDDNQATTGSGGGINVEGTASSQIHTNEINAPVYITNNRAGNHGGGVSMGSAALPENNTFRVNHFVTISNNTATNNGGGVHMNHANARLIMTGGEISNNTAVTNSGGGIWINAASRGTGLDIGPNAVFSGNFAGNGVFNIDLSPGDPPYPLIIGSTPNSVPNMHLLNNYDINNNVGIGPFWPVTFDLNGGNVGGNSSNIVHILEEGTSIGLSNVPAPTSSGFILGGWQQDGTGTIYSPADVADRQVSGALTFVAVWTPAWPVTFDLNGGNVGGNSSNIVHILEADTFIGLSNVPAPVFSGFIFGGWQQDGTGTISSSAEVADKQVSDALTFAAVWTPVNNTGGGGNGTGNATIREPARGGNITQPPVAVIPYAYEIPKPEEVPIIVILLFVAGVAAFAYRKVEEAKEKEEL